MKFADFRNGNAMLWGHRKERERPLLLRVFVNWLIPIKYLDVSSAFSEPFVLFITLSSPSETLG